MPHLYLAPRRGWPPSEFREDVFDADKTRKIGLPYGEKTYDNTLSRFHLIPERYGQTDGQTDRIAISISRVSVLTRDKNHPILINFGAPMQIWKLVTVS